MSRRFAALCIAVVLSPGLALAHVGIASGLAVANTSQEITFSVGHGCGTDDTYTVKVDIPAGVTSLRTVRSDFGKATVEKDALGNVTSVTWQKPDADLLPADTGYYKLTIRARMPNTPFTTLYFPTRQTCKSATGTLTVVDWVATTPQYSDAGMTAEPAPALLIVPARKPGWNKFTVTVAIPDTALPTFFPDAQIVWRGTEAYSSNAETMTLIGATSGVTKLTGGLQPTQEIWVKY